MIGEAGVGDVVAKLARAGRDRVAIIDAEAGISHSVGDVDRRRRQLANALVARGRVPGDRIAVMLRNSAPAAEVLYGIATAGMVQVNVNETLTASEIAHILTHSGAATAIVDESLLGVLDETGAEMDRIIVAGADGPFERLLSGASDSEPPVAVALDDPAILIYTSGTTGRPKGVTLSHRNVLESATNFLIEYFGPEATTHLACVPYFHVACVPNLAALMRGMTVVVCMFEADKVGALIERYAVTHASMPPTALALVLDADEAHPRDFRSLRRLLYAGSPMPEPLLRRATDRFGPILEQAYGMTETAGMVTILRAGDHDLSNAARLASCGRETTRGFVDIVDLDGEPLYDGTPGELVARGPNVMLGYWNDPDATRAAHFGDWFRTGDIAIRDADGFVTVVGRMKDLIITGANNVYPVEVEKALEQHPAVREVAVIGVPDPTWGETVAAVVVADEPVDIETVRAWCADRLADYKQPRLIFHVDEMPRNAIGKVDKPVLRNMLGESTSVLRPRE